MINRIRLSRLDLVAWVVLCLLGALVVLVALTGSQIGLSVSLQGMNPGEAVSPLHAFTLRFSRPVRIEQVFERVRFVPATAGRLVPLDEQSIQLIPEQPFQPGVEYTLQLEPGVMGENGERLEQAQTWSFRVRPPRVVYMTAANPSARSPTSGGERELWTIGMDDREATQLTFTDGKIYSFDAAPDGEWVAYTIFNDQGGMDLWRIARQGGEPQLLLDCAGERCSQPVWSPDSRRIAYSRQPAAIAPGAPPGAPRPWLLDVQSGQSTPVFDDSQIIGFGASWSPDGKRVAIYDGIAGELQVVELDSGEVVLLSSNTGTTGEWSPDGRYLLYTKVESGETSTHTMVMRADFTSGEIATLIGKGAEGHDAAYSVPDWSPAGDQLVLGLRLDPGSPEKHLWVIQPDYLGGAMIADEPGYTYSFYSWDPWGNAIVMQAFRLGTSEPSEVMLWTAEGGLRSLAKVAMLPDWLP